MRTSFHPPPSRPQTASRKRRLLPSFAVGTLAALILGSAPQAHAVDGVGLYDPNRGVFRLFDANGVPLRPFRFGPRSASGVVLPIAGNWDGASQAPAGGDTIGLHDRRKGLFRLRNSNDSGFSDRVLRFGPKNRFDWIAIAGDWNGNGRDSIGLYDPVSSIFRLRETIERQSRIIKFQFGDVGLGFVPVVGDWDQDGIDTVGLYDSTNGVFLLQNTNARSRNPALVRGSTLTPSADIIVRFGEQGLGWRPVTGNWAVSFFDSVGLFDPFRSEFLQRFTNTSGPPDRVIRIVPPGALEIPLGGDWQR